MSTLLLKLLDGDGQAIRGMDDQDGYQVFSVYDFFNRVCEKPEKSSYGNTTFFRLTQETSKFKNEVLTLCKNLKFPGSGQRETPCTTIRGLQRLLIILGGKVAANFREIVEGTFTRVMGGDQSLIEVINANAASNAPLQQAYRAALVQEPVAPVLEELCLGQKRDRESARELELAERKLRLEEGEFRLKEREKALEHVNWGMELMDSLKAKSNIDERTKLQFEDHIKNVVLSSSNSFKQKTIGNVAKTSVNETESLSVSVLAAEMGYRCSDKDVINIGRAIAAKYRETYKRSPPKHKQYVKGNYIPVNSYMERDRSMMEKAARMIMEGGDSESCSSLAD
jgi:hypothetical protein